MRCMAGSYKPWPFIFVNGMKEFDVALSGLVENVGVLTRLKVHLLIDAPIAMDFSDKLLKAIDLGPKCLEEFCVTLSLEEVNSVGSEKIAFAVALNRRRRVL